MNTESTEFAQEPETRLDADPSSSSRKGKALGERAVTKLAAESLLFYIIWARGKRRGRQAPTTALK